CSSDLVRVCCIYPLGYFLFFLVCERAEGRGVVAADSECRIFLHGPIMHRLQHRLGGSIKIYGLAAQCTLAQQVPNDIHSGDAILPDSSEPLEEYGKRFAVGRYQVSVIDYVGEGWILVCFNDHVDVGKAYIGRKYAIGKIKYAVDKLLVCSQ